MSEPISILARVALWVGNSTLELGIKATTVAGGALGSAIALANMNRMGRWRALSAYLTGVCVALGVGPLVSYWLRLPEALNFPLGFTLGTAGMGLVYAAVNDPIRTLRRIVGASTNEEKRP